MMRRRPIARAAVRTTAVVGTAAVVGGHMANKQAAQAQRAAAEAPPAAAAPEPAAAAPDPIEQLTQLAALKDSGLTEAEFEAQKPSSWVRRAVFETATATRVMGRVVSAVAILRVRVWIRKALRQRGFFGFGVRDEFEITRRADPMAMGVA